MQDKNMITDNESEQNDISNSDIENDRRLDIGKEIDITNDLLIKAKFIFGDDDLQYLKILQAKIQLEKLLAHLTEDKIKTGRYKKSGKVKGVWSKRQNIGIYNRLRIDNNV